MRSIRVAVALLVPLLVSAACFAGDQTELGALEAGRNLPWVTPAVNASRVSFHVFDSSIANSQVSFHVYTPTAYDRSPAERFPVLYWLHGTEGGVGGVVPVARLFHAAMRDRRAPPMIIVFVNGLPRHLWTDSKDGLGPVETVFVEELIPLLDKSMRTIACREGRIIEGFSMGGYGAARIGFKHPDLFAGISILAAGPLDLDFQGPRAIGNPLREQILREVCNGDLEYYRAHHPWTIAESNAQALRRLRPIIRQAVGGDDASCYLSRRFHQHLDELGIQHEFEILNGVGHDARALFAALGTNNTQFYNRVLCPANQDTQPRSAKPDAAPEAPPAAAVLKTPETVNPKPDNDTPADGGGR